MTESTANRSPRRRTSEPSRSGEARRFDLHSHSLFSDGSFSASDLIEQARSFGLAGLAVTDHDGVAHLSAVRAAARAARFPVLAGIEASAHDPATGRKVHILGFGLEATADGSGPIERIVAETRARRTSNTRWQAKVILNAIKDSTIAIPQDCSETIDAAFSLDAVANAAAKSSAVYKQHVMEALCHLPYRDGRYQRLYRLLFKGDGLARRDIAYPIATDVVRAIREQGGHPVLAHPGQMDSWASIPSLAAAGLEGIEVHHPDHTEAHVRRAQDAADRYGLFATGGSDFHGRYGAPDHLGCCTIDAEEAGDRVEALFAQERLLR